MFEQEHRPQQQISREAAERFAIMVAIQRAGLRPSAYAASGAQFGRLVHLLLKPRDVGNVR